MSMLKLALAAKLPLIHVTTDDVLNLEHVVSFIAEETVKIVSLPETIGKPSDIKLDVSSCKLLITSNDCLSLVKLYRWAQEQEVTILFVNCKYNVLMFDGGPLYPPIEMVREFLESVVDADTVDDLLPSYGGLTLKDVSEVSSLTMTRDGSLTAKGVNETRRNYQGKLRGIDQVDTDLGFYDPPLTVSKWIKANRKFFLESVHASLVPRGLLFDGPPGTGKTLAAKFIASQLNIPLYRLDLGAMMGKYVGDSEKSLMAALAQVDQVEPCVVLFDEVEKIFSTHGGDSGVSSRMLSQLLWWLQEHKTRVFSIMTTNNAGSIPKELHRPGRIDASIYFAGLGSLEDGLQFARNALQSMAKEIGHTLTAAEKKAFDKRVTTLFGDGQAVPQATVTQTVFASLKEYASDSDED